MIVSLGLFRGDFVFKRNTTMKPEEQMVIALPDVEYRDINDEWEFILLACDGIWDVRWKRNHYILIFKGYRNTRLKIFI